MKEQLKNALRALVQDAKAKKQARRQAELEKEQAEIAEKEAQIRAEQEARAARILAEQKAEEKRIRAEQEAEEKRVRAEQEAEAVRIRAEQEAREKRIKAEQEARAEQIRKEQLEQQEKRYQRALKWAKRKGLFEIAWYQDHYGIFDSELDAFKDYLYKSPFANVNPSAKFDNEAYLRMNQDVYHEGNSPLLHYAEKGYKENRAIIPAHLRWFPKNVLSTDKDVNAEEDENELAYETPTFDRLDNIEGQDSWQAQKIAICLHIYYEDFIEKFAACLEQFPCEVDVFVSVCNEPDQKVAKSYFEKIDNVKDLNIVVAPNRGRNFGPMLVEFGKDLLKYDLLCHLHSKKSLYSGREQTQWFDYLNQFLFKDKHVVSELLRLFDQNPEFGVYYPTSFWMMPDWVNHWTCNKSYAADFVAQWQLDISDNFVNYPVGGMFWARPKAIKQLLNKDYCYDDFPEEPLANDGSWLHALERSIGLLAEKNQFTQFFYYPPAGKFTTDNSYIYANYKKPPEQLRRELSNFEVVSFDVFDTLLRREYTEPDYAKYLVGKELVDQGLFPTAQSFVSFRNQLEAELRQKLSRNSDVSIVQVYELLRERIECDDEQARAIMQLEFEKDLAQVQPKDEMVWLLHCLADLGRQIWLISDTYYTQQQIEIMLRKIGVAAPYELMVSSELGLRKDTGSMWQFIKQRIDTDKVSHIHVGDNVRSDAQICGDFGLTNMHILHPVDKWRAAGFAQGLQSDGEELDEIRIVKWGKLINNFGRYPFFGE